MTSIAPLMYVDSDLPIGMTLVDWRRTRTLDQPRTRRGFLRRIRRLAA